jgi:PTS system, fructose subfamily, IIA component
MEEMLKVEYVFTDQQPEQNNVKSALKLIGEKCSPYAGIKANNLTKAFLAREKMDSTGFGEQLAIPHAKVKKLKQPMVAVFRFREGIEWDSMDGQPVKVAIALIMPDGDEDNTHLTILAKLARKLVHQEFMDNLLNMEDKVELYQYILKEMED